MISLNEKNKELAHIAELIGILLGDGSLSLHKYNPTLNNRLKISFNSRDDLDYTEYVRCLLLDIFGVKPILKFRKEENTADLYLFKKNILEYLVDQIGVRLSPKWNRAIIPKDFCKNHLDVLVIRGYFDTDGCVVITNNNGIKYPRLEMKVCPSPMQFQFINILKKYNFRFGVYNIGKGKVRIQLNGIKQLTKWMSLIGFSNEKHLKKVIEFI